MSEERRFDTGELRRAFGAFLTGVTVVTAPGQGGVPIGMTANSFTSVSLDPPLVLVCVGSGSSSFAHFAAAPVFAVNILKEGQTEIASLFARRGADRFASVGHRAGATGSPILDDCLAWFDCTLHQRVVAGDHLVLIGQVQAFATQDGPPLGFSRGKYVVARDGHAAPAPMEANVTAYLIDRDGQILLRRDPAQGWTLPTAHRPRIGVAGALDGAPDKRLVSERTFIYSVYGEPDGGPGFLVYRASLEPGGDPAMPPASGLAWFPADALPWDEIRSRPLRSLLQRYVHERRDGRFSVYVDTGDGGRVALLQEGPRAWSSLDLASTP